MTTQRKEAQRVKELFETEESHYHIFSETCLPSEMELCTLRAFVLKKIPACEWPQDMQFDSELDDRLTYVFRESLINHLKNGTDQSQPREDFLEKAGEEIALRSFEEVKKEYRNQDKVRIYWGERVGYFS